jgi:hypothetical protein
VNNCCGISGRRSLRRCAAKAHGGTYHNLRLGVGVIGIAFPIVVWLGGMILDDEPLRSLMSAYYYSDAMRNTFGERSSRSV